MNVFILCMLVLVVTDLSYGQIDNQHWFDSKWLDENYLFKWKSDDIKKAVVIRVEVQTKGWVGFGFSQHGNASAQTDLVIGWVDYTGRSTFNDFWVNESGIRSLDKSQDWKLLRGEENATHTVLEFCRHYVTCDESNDLQIFDNEFEISNLVYAYSFIDPKGVDTIGRPVVEEIFHLNLFKKEEPFSPKETDVEVVDNWMNVTMPPNSETMFCHLYKNKFQQKHQVIKVKSITLPSGMKFKHHFALLTCEKDAQFDNHLGKTFQCYDPHGSLQVIRKRCSFLQIEDSILTNDPLVFDDNTGLGFDIGSSPYILFEAHVKNPMEKPLDVQLSLTLWLTKQFRKYESTLQTIHASTGLIYDNWGFILPPKQSDFKIAMVISTYCFENEQFDDNGIYITHVLLHSHHALKIEFRHYRNSEVIESLTQNHYDPEYQPIRRLKTAINFRRNDKILMICDYNTLALNESIMSPKEHCTAGLYYYPKMSKLLDEKIYFSRLPYSTMLKITGLQQIDGYDTEFQQNMLIRRPVEHNNTKLIDFVAQNKYKVNDPKQLEELQISEDLEECCYLANLNYAKTKPCVTIRKPPGLYQSVISEIKQNTCSSKLTLAKNKAQEKVGSTSVMKGNDHKLLLSFKISFNSLKLSFDAKF